MLDAVARINPARVVFDSLSELRLLAQNSLRYRRQILAFKQFFVGKQCTVLLLDDRTSEGPDTATAQHRPWRDFAGAARPGYGAERRRLRIMKFRGTDLPRGLSRFPDPARRDPGLPAAGRRRASRAVCPHANQERRGGIGYAAGGGPDRGTSTLLMGPAGSGKSTIAVQYAVAAAERGDHAAIFAFDESVGTLEARTAALGIRFKEGCRPGAG